MKKAFTLIELIFTIVIIGVLASVAIPKLSGLTQNSKKAAELSVASSVQTALEACHGEWIINESSFICGTSIDSSDPSEFNQTTGYPTNNGLGDSDTNPLNKILKNGSDIKWSRDSNQYKGPAGNIWLYHENNGTFVIQ
ncbi:MAG: type II secretion system protein [Campylobacterales bacterium]|nr:type II secretion system protein [Campylobacterales bacterium]